MNNNRIKKLIKGENSINNNLDDSWELEWGNEDGFNISALLRSLTKTLRVNTVKNLVS